MSWARSLQAYAFPLAVYLGWRASIFLYQVIIQPYMLLTKHTDTVYERVFLSWAAYWDSGHVAEIVRQGYQSHPQLVLFPAWPLLVKLTTLLGIHVYTASFAVTFILGAVVWLLLYVLAQKLTGQAGAKRALLLFTVYPGVLFLHAGYSENLFLALVLISFLLLEKGRAGSASIAAAFASATRVVGITIAPMFLLGKPGRMRIVYAAITLLGLLLYMLYLQISFGDAFAFLTKQAAWGKAATLSTLVFPLTPLLDTRYLTHGLENPFAIPMAVDWCVAVLFLALTPLVYRKLGIAYAVYALGILAIPLSSGTYVGMNRYALPAFPVFAILGSYLSHRALLGIVLGALFLLQLHFINLFTNLVWVG